MPMPSKPAPVLLIEDNDAQAMIIEVAMRSSGVDASIVRAGDGRAALEMLDRAGRGDDADPLPALVLLDLQLPKVHGLDVLRHIKGDDRLRGIPVVVLSTSSADRDVVAAAQACANSYLVKPVEFERLSEMLRATLHYWLAWHQPFRNNVTGDGSV
jgi:CheY-like chemotaxis protein